MENNNENTNATYEPLELYGATSVTGARLAIASAPQPDQVLFIVFDAKGEAQLAGSFPLQPGEFEDTVQALNAALIGLGYGPALFGPEFGTGNEEVN